MNSGVLNSEDPFCITFGKQNWPLIQQTKIQCHPNSFTPNKKLKKMTDHECSSERSRRYSQTNKKKTIFIKDLCKQNVDNNTQTVRRSKARLALTDRSMKQSMHIGCIRQQMTKRYLNNNQNKSLHGYPNLFDLELNKKIKDIETVSKIKMDRIKINSQNRKMDLINEAQIILDKFKLAKVQPAKKTKFKTINPTINRYKQEMTKIDSLIGRINARISLSGAKNVKQNKHYAFEKA